MPTLTAELCQCPECLRDCKTYELDEEGLCARCAPPARSDGPPLAPWPTEHVPGTEGKLITLEWRAANGFALWHPDDAVGHAPVKAAEPKHMRESREPRTYRAAAG